MSNVCSRLNNICMHACAVVIYIRHVILSFRPAARGLVAYKAATYTFRLSNAPAARLSLLADHFSITALIRDRDTVTTALKRPHQRHSRALVVCFWAPHYVSKLCSSDSQPDHEIHTRLHTHSVISFRHENAAPTCSISCACDGVGRNSRELRGRVSEIDKNISTL